MSLVNGQPYEASLDRTARISLTSVLDKFPSSALNSSEKDKKEAIKQGNAVFAFTLKNSAGETESWHIDLKNSGKVGKGLPDKPNGAKFPFGISCHMTC
jgi:hypothetical protein